MLRKFFSIVLACAMVIGCLTACGNEAKTSEVSKTETTETAKVETSTPVETEKPKGPPTKLVLMNITNELHPDHDMVWDKINEILIEKLNVTVEYRNLTWAEQGQKYPLIVQSGEQIDILYCMSGSVKTYAEKGAFTDLTELAPEYAPNLYGALSEDQIAASKVNGKMYILPPNYIFSTVNGVAVRGDLMDKYGIKDIATFDDFIKYMETVYANEKDFTLYSEGTTGYLLYAYNEYADVPGTSLAVFDSSEGADHSKIEFIWENEKKIEYYKAVEKLYQSGVMPKDAVMSSVNSQTGFIEGTLPAASLNMANFALAWQEIQKEHADWDPRFYWFDKEATHVISPISNGWVIPTTSKYPELALQVMDLLAMDEELHNLVNYGIEGVHYVVKDGQVALPDGVEKSTYSTYGTVHQNQDYRMNTAGYLSDYDERVAEFIEKGHISPFAGFAIDKTAIETEFANMNSIMKEYNKSLTYGALPVDETLEEIKEKMEAAGCVKVRKEIETQLAAFLAK